MRRVPVLLFLVFLPCTVLSQIPRLSASPVYDRASYLCRWVKVNPPPENVGPPSVCTQTRAMSGQEARDEMRGWFSLWGMRRDPAKPDPEAAFDTWHGEQLLRKLRQVNLADERRKRAAQSIPELCSDYLRRGSMRAFAELQKRKAFDERDLELVLLQKVALGMSETALTCSWGPTVASPARAATGERSVYDYGEVEIEVEAGNVVLIDDRRG